MDSKTPFDINLNMFGKGCSAYVRQVKEGGSSHLQFCETRRGELNLCKKGKGETTYYHSQEGALEEAERWFQELIDIHRIDTLFVFGIGLGYYYEAAKHWLKENPRRFLIFLEDDCAVLHAFFHTEKARDVLSNPQVILLAFQSSKGEKQAWIRSDFDTAIKIGAYLPYASTQLKLYEKSRRQLCSQLQLYLSFRFSVLERETFFFKEKTQKTFFHNFFHNLFSLPQSYFGHRLFGQFPKIPAIICGAGPSLKKQCPLLAQVQDKALIFGTGTAMNVLNKEGVIAHFGAGVDPNEASRSRIMTNFAYETPYFYENTFYQEAFELLHGPKLYFRGFNFFGIEEWFNHQFSLDNWDSLPYFSSTTSASLSIALALGCDP
ncbi:MAG: 6-hydroxymethylpterin diphosphokinase MptE-like protein, partial [Waddliaceae bacterium]